jgi:flavin-dependent dehydrogenase
VAITLAGLGQPALVLEAAPAAQAKTGECLPPTSAAVLHQLGMGSAVDAECHLRSHGNRSSWGSDEPIDQDFLFGLHGPGWHLDRQAFEAHLARVAVERGAEWRYGTQVRHVRRRCPGWELSVLDSAGRPAVLEADFVVDATGRRASVGRRLGARRVGYDRLVGAAALLEPGQAGLTDTYTLVEAVPGGWWYSALLADGRLSVAFMSDADLPELRQARHPPGWWRLLDDTRLTRSRVRDHGYTLQTAPRVLAASSTRLSAILGDRWLAVGDAAAAHDPLASHGIVSALGSGIYAGRAIADMLAGCADASVAYLSLLQNAYASYLEAQQACYLGETRWIDSLFWARRRSSIS